MAYRLGIVTTHPIQYQVPWFHALAARPEIELTVFFCQLPDAALQGDGFGIAFDWDVPLLNGYRYEVLPNVAASPSVTTFRGCDTPDIYRKINNQRFDAIIVNGWVAKSCLQALWACRRARVPCIVRGESNSLRKRTWWKRLIHRGLLSQYSAFLTIGSANADFYRSHGIAAERMFPGPYCVDNIRFSSEANRLRPCRAEFRAKWGIPSDIPTFLFCGKFIRKKHPLTLLRAAADACNRGAALHLLMVGDGELRADCEAFAKDHHLPATFTGFLNQSRLPEAYVTADAIVLPSDDGETWGLVVNEAMACGLPAVVSDRVGCAADLVVPELTGARFPCGDERSLSEIIRRLATSRGILKEMGQNACRHIANYSIETLTEGTIQAIHNVCGTESRKDVPTHSHV